MSKISLLLHCRPSRGLLAPLRICKTGLNQERQSHNRLSLHKTHHSSFLTLLHLNADLRPLLKVILLHQARLAHHSHHPRVLMVSPARQGSRQPNSSQANTRCLPYSKQRNSRLTGSDPSTLALSCRKGHHQLIPLRVPLSHLRLRTDHPCLPLRATVMLAIWQGSSL